MWHAPKVIDHLDMWLPSGLRGLFWIALEIIDARDAAQKIEAQLGLIAQIAANVRQCIRRDLDPGVNRFEIRPGNLVAKALLQAVEKRLAWRHGSEVGSRKSEVGSRKSEVERVALASEAKRSRPV